MLPFKPRPKIYVASKIRWASQWLELANNAPSLDFIASWPNKVAVDGELDTPETAKVFWPTDIQEISMCDYLLFYSPPEDHHQHRGSLIEVGAALANWKKVYVVSDEFLPGTWQHHPSVTRCADIDIALTTILADWLRLS